MVGTDIGVCASGKRSRWLEISGRTAPSDLFPCRRNVRSAPHRPCSNASSASIAMSTHSHCWMPNRASKACVSWSNESGVFDDWTCTRSRPTSCSGQKDRGRVCGGFPLPLHSAVPGREIDMIISDAQMRKVLAMEHQRRAEWRNASWRRAVARNVITSMPRGCRCSHSGARLRASYPARRQQKK
jgi:hypothetical protein